MLLADFKLSRLVLAIVTVVTVADLLPHPTLAPGAIETTFTKLEQVFQPAHKPPATSK